MKRTVRDLMTHDVVVVPETASYKEVVETLAEKRISAVPVVDANGKLAGIVSEADLMLKQEYIGRTDQRLGRRRAERERARATIALEIMTTPVTCIGPGESAARAARLMHQHGVKRLPVVDHDGVVVGIISRADVLAVFARPDEDIRDEICQDVIRRKLWLGPLEAGLVVKVDEGVVTLEGWIDRTSMSEILEAVVGAVDGVVSVRNLVRAKTDDSKIRLEQPLAWGVLPSSLRRP